MRMGRGAGKTWVGANLTNEMSNTVSRMVLVGATSGDVRDVMIEGPSGIIETAPSWARPTYEPSKRRITWPNGSQAVCLSSEEPDRLRGVNAGWGWLDEFAAWKNIQDTYDMFSFGLRLGAHPKFLITTTPRPIKLLKEIMARPDVVTTHGSTYDNAENLAPGFLESIERRYGGTRLGKQEIYAEILDDVPGAMWVSAWIEDHRRKAYPFDGLKRIVVAIDPAVTSGENSDETGIIVAGIDFADRAYIIEDLSGRYQPHEWAAIAVAAYKRHQADRIVGEKNNGGDMIEATIRSVDPSVSFKAVTATRGKVVRAEPISALYEQGRVSHVGVFDALEGQMLQFTSDFSKASAGYSPDRLDAMVWALTELMLERTKPQLTFA